MWQLFYNVIVAPKLRGNFVCSWFTDFKAGRKMHMLLYLWTSRRYVRENVILAAQPYVMTLTVLPSTDTERQSRWRLNRHRARWRLSQWQPLTDIVTLKHSKRQSFCLSGAFLTAWPFWMKLTGLSSPQCMVCQLFNPECWCLLQYVY